MGADAVKTREWRPAQENETTHGGPPLRGGVRPASASIKTTTGGDVRSGRWRQ
jgi:hypothetical protein